MAATGLGARGAAVELLTGVLADRVALDDLARRPGFLALDPADRARAQRIFVQVVRPGEGTEDTRRLATRAELGDADWALVRRLADARLLVTGRDPEGRETVEVVHEALIRGWERLRGWMDA